MTVSVNEKDYDVCIVGGGIAGAILAKTLVNAGKSVIVLEAGNGVTPSDDVNGADLDIQRDQRMYQGFLDRFYRAAAKVPNAPYPNLKVAPSPDVLDIADTPSTKGYFVQKGPSPFGSDYARTPGGTTMHWLGTCLRMLPNDFRMKSKYGVAVDWPICYDELKPYYEMAEQEIGVSATVENLKYPNTERSSFFGDYVYPMNEIPTSYLDKSIEQALGARSVSVSDGKGGTTDVAVYVTPTPQGRNSTPNPTYSRGPVRWDPKQRKLTFDHTTKQFKPVGATWDAYTGQRCEGNASCVPICPVQAKYNALKTLRSVARREDGTLNPKLTILYRTVVSRVLVQDKSESKGDRPVTGISYKRYRGDGTSSKILEVGEYTIKARRYVLAAHAVENAKILLASGIANHSKQVGRNLMDHVTLLTWGLKDEPVYPFRGPGSTSNIPVFRDGEFRREHSGFILPFDNWGWSWPKFSPGSDLDDALDQHIFGKQLKDHLENHLTRQVLFHCECEQLPEWDNHVTIDERYKDDFGNYRPVIHYTISDYLKKAFVAGKQISDQLFEAAGIEDKSDYEMTPTDPCYFEYEGKSFFYRGAGHLVETHRMGFTRDDSVVNKEQRTWDHSNLYLVGCGNMATLGTSNPTLTMAALTFWAAENILNDLKGVK